MRIATCGAAAVIAALAMVSFVPAALAERDVTNPLTGEVVVQTFSRAPSNRELAKAGQKLAVKSLEKALALNPTFYTESPVACFNIGVMYLNARDAAKAKLFLRKCLELDPGHQGARKLLQGLGT